MNYLKEFNIFDDVVTSNMPTSIKDLIIGSRIELIKMNEEKDPIPPGTQGIILSIHPDPINVIEVSWENSNRTISLIFGVDIFKIIN